MFVLNMNSELGYAGTFSNPITFSAVYLSLSVFLMFVISLIAKNITRMNMVGIKNMRSIFEYFFTFIFLFCFALDLFLNIKLICLSFQVSVNLQAYVYP